MINVFVSYSHEDTSEFKRVIASVQNIIDTKEANFWYDKQIPGGMEYDKSIKENIGRAHLYLPLISLNFIASEYCRKELHLAYARAKQGHCRIMPIILRTCDWKNLLLESPDDIGTSGSIKRLGELHTHMDPKRRLDTLATSDEFYHEVHHAIRRMLGELRSAVSKQTMRFNTGKRIYQTRDSAEVSLEISVVGTFKSLQHIIDLQQLEIELDEHMAEITVAATGKVLRGAYVDRHYLRFEPPIDLEGQEIRDWMTNGKPQNYLADSIRYTIKSELERSMGFYCDSDDIQLVQRDDKVAKLILMIFELGCFQSEVYVEPLDKQGDANKFHISVTYQVQSVNPNCIHVVLRQEYTKEQLHNDIKQEIDRWTKQVLSTVKHNVLSDKTQCMKLLDQLDQMVRLKSTRFFGTEIKVISIEVNPTFVQADKSKHTDDTPASDESSNCNDHPRQDGRLH